MKYTLIIPQLGLVQSGLIGKLSIHAVLLLDYVAGNAGWFFATSARRATLEGKEYVWLNYENAVADLPLLFPPDTKLATRKNRLSKLVQELREALVLDSIRVGRDLYLRPTDVAGLLFQDRSRTVTKSTPIVTQKHDDTVTGKHDDTVTQNHDDGASAYINDSWIKDTSTSDTSPPTPTGVGKELVDRWNSCPDLPKIRELTPARIRRLKQRLSDPFFQEHWRAGLERVSKSAFCTGQSATGWKADVDWFLRPGKLVRIMEGAYDRTLTNGHRASAPPRAFDPQQYNQDVSKF